MKLLIIFGFILFVEFSQQIPLNKNDQKILPIKEKRKVNKISEILFAGNPDFAIKDDPIDEKKGYLKVSPQKRISRIGKLPPYKNLGIRSIKDEEKNDESFVLNDDELADLIVGEASEDLTGLKTIDHDSDNLQQRQKRGWFKKIWRSAEKRTKESIPVAAGAAVIGLFG